MPSGFFRMQISNLRHHLDTINGTAASVTIADGSYKNLIYKAPIPDSWFFVPQGAFTLDHPSEQDSNKMLEYGTGRDRPGSNVFTGRPDAASLAGIFKLGKLTRGPYVPGTVPAEGYLAYTLCLRVMNLYSHFSFYFTTGIGNIAVSSGHVISAGEMETKLVHQHASNTTTHATDVGGCPATLSFAVGLVQEAIVPQADSAIRQMFFNPLEASIPNLRVHNITFPYFEGMNLVDRDIITSEFRETFFTILGKDASTVVNVWKNLKGGLSMLGNLPAGRAVSHAFRGIQLSKEMAAGIVFLVGGGEYYGFILTKHDPFQVFAFGCEVKSVDVVTTTNIIGSVNQHSRALEAIVRLLREPRRPGTNEVLYDVEVGHIDTSRKLANYLRSTSRDQFIRATFDDDLGAEMEKLRFGVEFKPPTVSMIQTFLEFCLTGQDSLLDDYPAYLGGTYWRNKDRVNFGLGIFGEKAPSLNYGLSSEKTITFNLPHNNDPTDANVDIPEGGVRALRFLPFALVPVSNAANQWQSLFNTGRLVLPEGTTSRGKRGNVTKTFTDPDRFIIQVGNAPFFGLIYHQIKQITHTTKEGLRGGKRRRNEEEVETGARKKSKKQMIDLMEGME